MYVLVKFFFFIFFASFFTNSHGSHFVLAGSLNDENFEIHECVSKLKKRILDHDILFSEDIPEFSSASIQVNKQLQNNDKIKNKIYSVSYDKFDEPNSLQYSFDLINENKSEKITIEYMISVNSNDEKKESPIKITLNSYLFNNKKVLQNIMEQKFIIDQPSICKINPILIEFINIIELSDSNMFKTHSFKYDYKLKELKDHEQSEEFDSKALKLGTFDQLIKKNISSEQPLGETLLYLKDFNSAVKISWNKDNNEIVLDSSNTESHNLFTKYDMKIFLLGKRFFKFELYCSINSNIFFKESRMFDYFGELNTIGREFSYEAWISTVLNPPIIYQEKDKLQVIGFENKDFQELNLVYDIISPRQIKPYEGISIYGTWNKLDSDQIRNYNYKFVSKQESIHTQPICHDDVQSYLKETIYYDYSNESVKQILSQIKAFVEVEKKNQISKPKKIDELDLTLQMISKKVIEIVIPDHDRIEKKLGNKMIKASEIILTRKGVCKQFSTLFVTLARGLNIPTRAVCGWMVDEKSFGTHIWVEVLKNKQWLPLEPQRMIMHENLITHLKRNYIPRYSNEVNDENDGSEDTADLRLDECINIMPNDVILKKSLLNIH